MALYLAIVAVKLTNPLHGRYFRTTFVTEPFPHQTIMHGTFHWVVTGLSYALVAVGFFTLYELFLDADYDTRPLAALAGITITDNGTPIGDTDPASYFEYGSAIPDAEAGLRLPNLRMLAETHGWEATLDTSYQDGIRIVISGVSTPEQ